MIVRIKTPTNARYNLIFVGFREATRKKYDDMIKRPNSTVTTMIHQTDVGDVLVLVLALVSSSSSGNAQSVLQHPGSHATCVPSFDTYEHKRIGLEAWPVAGVVPAVTWR
jgi:hypothetical protein